jgi:ElaB/YqjD/DUF883 family membrane-anchored ribosome-binding protein
MEHLDGTQQETIDRIADEANDVQRTIHGAAVSAAVRAKRAQAQLVAAAGENLHKARSYITRNPLTTVGIAFAAGALLSRWIRR